MNPPRRLWHEISTQFLGMEDYPTMKTGVSLSTCQRIVVICTDRIGDTFNCLYFLSNLRGKAPSAKITFIGKIFNDKDFLRLLLKDLVDAILFKESLTGDIVDSLKCDIIFNLNPVSHIFSYFLPDEVLKVGHTSLADLEVRQSSGNAKSNEHLNLLRALGETVQLNYPPISFEMEKPHLAELTSRTFIALCPEATASTWMMEPEVTEAVIQHLLATTDHHLYIFGTNVNGNAQSYGAQDARIVNLTSKLPLSESLHVLSKARMVVSVDTGLMHAASYLGLPLVAVFTCGNPLRNGPQGRHGKAVVVRVRVDPPTGVTQKRDSLQSGIEKRFLKASHVIEAIDALARTTQSEIHSRILYQNPFPHPTRYSSPSPDPLQAAAVD